MRCFDEAPRFCSCDTSSACEPGCACDVNCVVPAWDDFACPAGAYRCHDGRCVAGAVACNGVSERADGSDESALCPNGALFDSPRGTGGCNGWVCGDGSCVGAARCDRVVQCADGSDEDAVCDLPSSFAREATVAGLDVFGVWAGPSGAWAAGSSGTVVHRDAGAWTRQPLSFGSYDLRSIWGSGSSSLFATINGSLLYWNGSTWSLLNLPTSASQRLWALWGTGPSDIWAVGSAGRAVTFCTSRVDRRARRVAVVSRRGTHATGTATAEACAGARRFLSGADPV